MLEVKGLKKGYGDLSKIVLKDVSFQFEKGVIYGLVGSNGVGKTTLLRCLNGIFKPDEGQVLLDEQVVYDNPAAKIKLSFINDSAICLPFTTVRGHGNYYKNMYEDSFDYTEFERLCWDFGVRTSAIASVMSLGQKKKMSIALAFAQKADYIIMDEPENGLDPESRVLFRNIIRNKADEGVGIILSSHDLYNLEQLCDEFLYINNREIQYSGTIEDAYEKVSKWCIKCCESKFADYVELESMGKSRIIIMYGNQEETRKTLETAGVEILGQEKIQFIDIYTLFTQKGVR